MQEVQEVQASPQAKVFLPVKQYTSWVRQALQAQEHHHVQQGQVDHRVQQGQADHHDQQGQGRHPVQEAQGGRVDQLQL